jgi:hypothetical protein
MAHFSDPFTAGFVDDNWNVVYNNVSGRAEKPMTNKKLTPIAEFEPQWKEGVNGELILKMWCPCGRKSRHRIRVPITTTKLETPWRRNGPSFSLLTIAPSVDTGCWHGTIEEGMVST